MEASGAAVVVEEDGAPDGEEVAVVVAGTILRRLTRDPSRRASKAGDRASGADWLVALRQGIWLGTEPIGQLTIGKELVGETTTGTETMGVDGAVVPSGKAPLAQVPARTPGMRVPGLGPQQGDEGETRTVTPE